MLLLWMTLHVCCTWIGDNLDRDLWSFVKKMLFNILIKYIFKGNISTQLLMVIHRSFDIQIYQFSQKTANMYVQITIYNHCKGGRRRPKFFIFHANNAKKKSWVSCLKNLCNQYELKFHSGTHEYFKNIKYH